MSRRIALDTSESLDWRKQRPAVAPRAFVALLQRLSHVCCAPRPEGKPDSPVENSGQWAEAIG
jgi:hypothetical protein